MTDAPKRTRGRPRKHSNPETARLVKQKQDRERKQRLLKKPAVQSDEGGPVLYYPHIGDKTPPIRRVPLSISTPTKRKTPRTGINFSHFIKKISFCVHICSLPQGVYCSHYKQVKIFGLVELLRNIKKCMVKILGFLLNILVFGYAPPRVKRLGVVEWTIEPHG